MQFLLRTILISTLLFSCTKIQVSKDSNNAFELLRIANFTDVRKCIVTSDQHVVYVGYAQRSPAILIVDAYMNPILETSYPDYALGLFNDVIETKDGGLILVGFTMSEKQNANEDDSHALVFKIDRLGNVMWQHQFDKYGYEQWVCITENEDGNFYLGGDADNQHLIAEISSTGALLKDRRMQFQDVSRASDVSLDVNGNPLFFANYGYDSTNEASFQLAPALTLRNKSNLNPIFQIKYPEFFRAGTNYEQRRIITGKIIQSSDGYLLFSTLSKNNPIETSILLLRTDLNGTLISQQEYNSNGNAIIENVVPYRDGYLLLGLVQEPDVNLTLEKIPAQYLIIAIDMEGNVLWESQVGTTTYRQKAFQIIEKDNRILVFGVTRDANFRSTFSRFELDYSGKLQSE